jgi:hypothetical protein
LERPEFKEGAKPGDTEQSKDGFISAIAGFREKIEQL